uniref:Uncharacterized protein n=3 Tax=Avena sativa TaxID=4498 RepID=A0ACD5UHT7_AVESA
MTASTSSEYCYLTRTIQAYIHAEGQNVNDGLMEDMSHLILYNSETADDKRALDAADDTEHSPPLHPRLHGYSKALPSGRAYSMQCAFCFKWRTVPSKEKYEELCDDTSEKHFVCARAREWNCILSCDDPEEMLQDGIRVWVTETPSISQSPHGLDWEFKTRGDGYTKFACGPQKTVAQHLVPHPEAPLIIFAATKSWQTDISGPVLLLSNFAHPGMCCFFPYTRNSYWRDAMDIDINDVLHSNGEWFLLREDRRISLWDVNMEQKWTISEVEEIVHQGYFTGKPPFHATIVLAQQHPPNNGDEAITRIWLRTAGIDANWRKESVRCSNEHKGLNSLAIHNDMLFWLSDAGHLCCVRETPTGLQIKHCEDVAQVQGMTFSLVQHSDGLFLVRSGGFLPPEAAVVCQVRPGGDSLDMVNDGLNGKDVFTIPKQCGFALSSPNNEKKLFTANMFPNVDCAMYSYEHNCSFNIKPCPYMHHLACSAVWAVLRTSRSF